PVHWWCLRRVTRLPVSVRNDSSQALSLTGRIFSSQNSALAAVDSVAGNVFLPRTEDCGWRSPMQPPVSQPRFPWLRLVIAMAAVSIFAVSRLFKGHREEGGWDAGRVLLTLVLWGIVSAIIVAILCFMHWRALHQNK